MIILVDSRQKTGKHTAKHKQLEDMGHVLLTCKLPYGDYMNGMDLPDELMLEICALDLLYKNDDSIPDKQRKAVSDALLELNLVSVDTKQDMQEVYGNIVSSHVRFRNECVISNGKLYILVEHGGNIKTIDDVPHWRNERLARWYMIYNAQQKGKMLHRKISKRPPISSGSLAEKMQTMSNKYGIEWQFCKKADTGKRIVELLGG